MSSSFFYDGLGMPFVPCASFKPYLHSALIIHYYYYQYTCYFLTSRRCIHLIRLWRWLLLIVLFTPFLPWIFASAHDPFNLFALIWWFFHYHWFHCRFFLNCFCYLCLFHWSSGFHFANAASHYLFFLATQAHVRLWHSYLVVHPIICQSSVSVHIVDDLISYILKFWMASSEASLMFMSPMFTRMRHVYPNWLRFWLYRRTCAFPAAEIDINNWRLSCLFLCLLFVFHSFLYNDIVVCHCLTYLLWLLCSF